MICFDLTSQFCVPRDSLTQIETRTNGRRNLIRIWKCAEKGWVTRRIFCWGTLKFNQNFLQVHGLRWNFFWIPSFSVNQLQWFCLASRKTLTNSNLLETGNSLQAARKFLTSGGNVQEALMWIWICTDPHLLGFPRSGSGSILGMRIRIQGQGNKYKTWIPTLWKGFCTYVGTYVYSNTYLQYFSRNIFCDAKFWPGSGSALSWLPGSGSALR